LEAALKQELGLAAELIKGDRGIFDVRVDGELIFSKKTAGRFPRNGEISQIVRDRQ
jgi:selenoprotein W-related protein